MCSHQVPVSPPPTPKLHPCTSPSPVPQTEFDIFDTVPTDSEKYGSAVVDYPEEILTSWHRWYSSDESDIEDDWQPHVSWSSTSPQQSRPTASLSDRSSSSAAEDSSDEDYSCAQVLRKPVGRGRGRGRKVEKEGKKKPGAQSLKLVSRVRKTPPPPPIVAAATTTTTLLPPPLCPVTASNDQPVRKLTSHISFPQVSKNSPAKVVHEPNLLASASVKKEAKTTTVPSRIVSHTPVTTPTGVVQYYPIQVQNIPSLVPVQLVGSTSQTVQSSSVSYQMTQTQSGKLVLLPQSGSQSQQYALQAVNSSTHTSGSPQRVSVIMNPGNVIYTTQRHTPISRGYIAQLDGPPGSAKKTKGRQNKEGVKKKFEAARAVERQRKRPVSSPASSSHSPLTQAQSTAVIITTTTCNTTSNTLESSQSTASSSENLMNAQLQSYLSCSERELHQQLSKSPSPTQILSAKTQKRSKCITISKSSTSSSPISTTVAAATVMSSSPSTLPARNHKSKPMCSSSISSSINNVNRTTSKQVPSSSSFSVLSTCAHSSPVTLPNLGCQSPAEDEGIVTTNASTTSGVDGKREVELAVLPSEQRKTEGERTISSTLSCKGLVTNEVETNQNYTKELQQTTVEKEGATWQEDSVTDNVTDAHPDMATASPTVQKRRRGRPAKNVSTV